ncbi:MAG: ATP-dependent sacrificial sulfur transferase LarE [Candidatus Nitrospinota bacterium M3_3B_026]
MNILEAKLDTLAEWAAAAGSCVLAFSGGVDSSFLLKILHGVMEKTGGRVLAVTARSSTYPARELEEAVRIAKLIGAEHRVIDSEELEIEGYAENPPDRCYHCKGELFRKLVQLAENEGFNVVYDGANADDARDFRPGSKAAEELGVKSPLKEAGLTKNDIRELSRRMGLPTWDKPAFACLASRFPYGSRITPQKLSMVEAAEEALRGMGFTQLRARHHGDVIRIELSPEDIPRAVEPAMAERIHAAMKEAGFLYTAVDILGYRTGAMNEALGRTAR